MWGILAFGLAVFVALVLWRAQVQESHAEHRYPPEGRIISVGEAKVHVVEMGEGPDLVLIHGASGNTRDMTFSLAGKLARDFRVIVFDRPGLGYTPSIDPAGDSLQSQATFLQAAASQIGAGDPVVMGHSYGGAVALAWAIHHPDNVSALVLVAAASNPWTTPLDPLYRVTASWWGSLFVVPLITAFVPDKFVQGALESVFAPQSAPDGYGNHVGAGLTLRRSSMRANALQRANLLDDIKQQVPLYQAIEVPTEIIHGTEDTTVGIHIHSIPLAGQIPEAVLTPLEGIGHAPHHVAEDEVIDAIHRAARRAQLR
ncbi:MAG: alpha/beta hydrolase [Paracoccaceae bacterium]